MRVWGLIVPQYPDAVNLDTSLNGSDAEWDLVDSESVHTAMLHLQAPRPLFFIDQLEPLERSVGPPQFSQPQSAHHSYAAAKDLE